MFGQFAIPIGIVLVVVILASFVILLAKRYKRCPSNRILVVYGKVRSGEASRTLHGGAAFVIPLIQDYEYLSLEPIQIEVPLKDALSIENIRVNVPSVFTVAVGTQRALMQNAAIRLLGLNIQQIKKQAEDIIFGQLRQVIASMSIEDINRDREKFLHNVQTSLEPELLKIGLVLINVNITDITDESGYIEAIGQKAASQAVQQARGDVADQEKMGEVRVAEAERDKMIQVADARKQRNIGIREAEQIQAVRVAELQKEQEVGEQTAHFQQDVEVKNREQEMRISVADAEATAIKGEKEADRDQRVSVADANATAVGGENTAQALIAHSNAELKVKQSDAYQLGETRKQEAEAAVVEARNYAFAKAAVADAERVEQERRAQLEAPAKAEKAQTIVEAEAEAAKRSIEAEGEAKAIFAKLEAEARGQYEILAKKGDGLARIVDACGGSDEAFQMLLLEHLDNLADSAATAISNIKFDKVIVWEGGGQDGKSATGNFLQGMAHTLPPMLQVMRDIGGVELPETLVKLAGEEAGDSASAEVVGEKKAAPKAAKPATPPAKPAPGLAPEKKPRQSDK
jgi:flotillin